MTEPKKIKLPRPVGKHIAMTSTTSTPSLLVVCPCGARLVTVQWR